MTTSVGYLYGTRQDASDARREARPDYDHGGRFSGLQPGVIKAVQASGVYQVGVIADGDGNTDTVIDGVRTFPAADLSVDDAVWLVWTEGSPVPTILVTGGSGCAVLPSELGVYFDDAV